MVNSCGANSLLGAMDRLWFHQLTVLSSVPTSQLLYTTLKAPQQISQTLACSSSNTSQAPLLEEEISYSAASATTPVEDDCDNQHDDEEEKEIKLKLKAPTRLSSITSKSQSHSSSPPDQFPQKRPRSYSGAAIRLQKTMSCKTLSELELLEVKGFMDLGFKFSKEQLSPRMMSVVPGLQRIGSWDHTNEDKNEISDGDHEVIEEEEEEDGEDERRGVMRPYLSEAWIVNRPESPLPNMRLPRNSAAADMKKHIRYWARTVASLIRQES